MVDELSAAFVVPESASDNWRSCKIFLGQRGLQIGQRTFCISPAAFTLANFGFWIECWKNSEVGFHRLKIFEAGMRDVMTQRAKHRGLREGQYVHLMISTRRIDACQNSRGNIPHIAFHTSDLTGKEKIIALKMLQCWTQKLRRSNKCVPMHLSKAYKLCLLQT